MGHLRLGTLPDTRPWHVVIGHLADGGSVAVVAAATTQAVTLAFQLARTDPGVTRTVWLLARLVAASRQDDLANSLAAILPLPETPTLLDVTLGMTEALQTASHTLRLRRSDLAVMAELAANESLIRCVGDRAVTLLATASPAQPALRPLGTPQGFAILAHEFFTRFCQRLLHYHLDRELSAHIGGNGRFPDRAACRQFKADLEIHCREASFIVRTYARDWYSKSKFENQLAQTHAGRFTRVCLTKLEKEFLIRGASGG